MKNTGSAIDEPDYLAVVGMGFKRGSTAYTPASIFYPFQNKTKKSRVTSYECTPNRKKKMFLNKV